MRRRRYRPSSPRAFFARQDRGGSIRGNQPDAVVCGIGDVIVAGAIGGHAGGMKQQARAGNCPAASTGGVPGATGAAAGRTATGAAAAARSTGTTR